MNNGRLHTFAVKLCIFLAAVTVAASIADATAILFHGSEAAAIATATSLIFVFVTATAFVLLQHRSIQHTTLRLQQSASELQLTRLDRIRGTLSPLVDAINNLIDDCSNTVSKARLQVKELEIQLKVVTAERRHAESIIQSISDGVLVTDPFDEVILANESAARTFDFDLSRADRSPVDQVLRDKSMIALIKDMRKSNSQNGSRIVEHSIRTPLGARIFKITLSSVSEQFKSEPPMQGTKSANHERSSAGVVAVLHDMTHDKEIAEMKNDFVSNVSHELRTPLASIKAYVEMLIDGEAEDERTRNDFYEVIQGESNRLSRLIDNILNISRIESGLVKISRRPESISAILQDAIDVISPQAQSKSIQIRHELPPLFYQTVADKDMLHQAALNLLSNAVKYTPDNGTVTISSSVNETKRTIITKITDTGVGIPPKDLPFVFDKFYRAEANNHMAKGTGLGLSLVKHIIENVHKGTLFVESSPGKGSCFGFELKLAE